MLTRISDRKTGFKVKSVLPPVEGVIVQTPKINDKGQFVRDQGVISERTLWAPLNAFQYFRAGRIWFESEKGSQNYIDPRTTKKNTQPGTFTTPYGELANFQDLLD